MAYERVGVTPDMVTVAKPLAGGLPMGAVFVKQEIADTIKPGDHGTTFGGGPLVAAVADHVVRRIAEPAFLATVRENGEWLGERLAMIARKSDRVRAVRGMGYMWGVDVVDPASEIVQRGWDEGLLVITAGDHTLRLLPPLIIERNAMIGDVVQQISVFAQAAAVTNTVRAAHVNGLGNRLGAVGFPRVDGAVDVVVAHELKRRPVVLGGKIRLRAGEIEADDAAALVRHRKLRHLVRRLGRDVADAAHDHVRLDAVGLAGAT